MRTLYHGTSSVNLDCIKSVGLEPGHAKGGVVYAKKHHMVGVVDTDNHRPPSVFVAIDQDRASEFARIAVEEMGGKPVVIVLHVPEDMFVTFSVDEAYEGSSYEPHAWLAPRIPADCISKVIPIKEGHPEIEGLNDLRDLLAAYLSHLHF